MKYFLTFGLMIATLSACSNPGTTVNAPIQNPAPSFDRQQTERLLGNWRMDYKIISQFTDNYRLDRIEENPNEPGKFLAVGVDTSNGSLAGGAYNAKYAKYAIVGLGTTFDQFYLFEFSPTASSTNATGCYFMILHPKNELSDCFILTATKKALGSTSFSTLTSNANLKLQEIAIPLKTSKKAQYQAEYQALKLQLEQK
jgi:hypothetical protein